MCCNGSTSDSCKKVVGNDGGGAEQQSQEEEEEPLLLLNDLVVDSVTGAGVGAGAGAGADTDADNSNERQDDTVDVNNNNEPQGIDSQDIDSPDSADDEPEDDLYDLTPPDVRQTNVSFVKPEREKGGLLSKSNTAPPVLCRRSILRRTRTKTPKRDRKRQRPGPVKQEVDNSPSLSPTSSVEGSSNDDPIDLAAFDDDY